LADLKGEAWFLSTPRGFNFFKSLFDYGQDSARTDWASWQLPTSENPFIDPEEIEAARADMSEGLFNQEFLAMFVDSAGSVFRFVLEAVRKGGTKEPERRREYVFGVDWGRQNDFTAIAVIDTAAHEVVRVERFTKLEYSLQLARVKALYERWRPADLIAEANSIGGPVIEQLRRDGVRVTAFQTTHASKANAIEGLALAFERRDIKIPDDQALVGELLAYAASESPGGLVRYSAPYGQHDDMVMALAIGWTAVSGQASRGKLRAMWL
jgi:phage FluMu gp28-like protein